MLNLFWDELHLVPQSVLFLQAEEGGHGLVHLARSNVSSSIYPKIFNWTPKPCLKQSFSVVSYIDSF